MVEAILWRLRTGAPGRDLPDRYGPWQSVSTRFRRWPQAGIGDRVRVALVAERDAAGDRDWSLPFLDGTTRPRPPACSGGAKGGGDQALGRSRGGWGTKLHLRTERGGNPVTWTLPAGQAHEATPVTALLEHGAVVRPGGGRPRLRPERVAGDTGDTGRSIRRYLRRRGIGTIIPRHRTAPRHPVRPCRLPRAQPH